MAGYVRNAEEGDETGETTPLIGRGFLERYSSCRGSLAWVNLIDPQSRLGLKTLQQDDAYSPANQLAQEGRLRLGSGDQTTGRTTGTSRSSHRSNSMLARSNSARSPSRTLSRSFSARGGSGLDARRQRDRLASRSRRSSIDSVYSTVGFTPGSPGSPASPGHGSARYSRSMTQEKRPHLQVKDFRETLVQIRNEGGSEQMPEEQAMPGMPKACTGFHSTAHLRTDEYWDELLGRHDGSSGPCRWVEELWFDVLVGIAVITNALLVGIHSSEAPSWHWWAMQYPLLLGLLELAARLLRWRRGLRSRDTESLAVQLLDAAAVVGIASLVWGQKLVKVLNVSVGDGPELFICLLSLLRLARLVHLVPGLHELARGIMDALQGLFWVLVLMALMLYAVAILCTRLIGHAEFGSGDVGEGEEAADVRAEFSNVGASMFLLFQVTSAWSLKPLLPLFKVSLAWQIAFSLFYIFCGWMLLAVMTGTVSFTMIAMRARMVGEDIARDEERRLQATEHILQIFRDFDLDDSGEISHKELMQVVQLKEIQYLLKTHTNIQVGDLEELFSWIDDDKSGSVSFAEFTSGFRWLNDSFKTQNLLRLREKVTKDMKQQLRRMEAMVANSFDLLTKEVDAPVKKLHALSEQVQLAHYHAVETTRCHEAPRAIADLEQRVGEQVEAIVERAEKLAAARWGEQRRPQGGRRLSMLTVEREDNVTAIRSLKCTNLDGLDSLLAEDEGERWELGDEGDAQRENPDSRRSSIRSEVPIRQVPSLKAHFDLGEAMSETSVRSMASSAAPMEAVPSMKVQMDLGEEMSEGSNQSQKSAVPIQAMTSMKSTLELLDETSSVGSKASKASKASKKSDGSEMRIEKVGSMRSSLALELDDEAASGASAGPKELERTGPGRSSTRSLGSAAERPPAKLGPGPARSSTRSLGSGAAAAASPPPLAKLGGPARSSTRSLGSAVERASAAGRPLEKSGPARSSTRSLGSAVEVPAPALGATRSKESVALSSGSGASSSSSRSAASGSKPAAGAARSSSGLSRKGG